MGFVSDSTETKSQDFVPIWEIWDGPPHKSPHWLLLRAICFWIVRLELARLCFPVFSVFSADQKGKTRSWTHRVPCFLTIRRRNRFENYKNSVRTSHKIGVVRHWRRSNWFQIVRWWDFKRLFRTNDSDWMWCWSFLGKILAGKFVIQIWKYVECRSYSL